MPTGKGHAFSYFCYEKKMKHSKKTGTPIERPGEQLLEYPLSLCDSDGNPLKGQKVMSLMH